MSDVDYEYEFEEEIRAGDRGGAYVEFPFDVLEEFDVKGRVPIQCSFDGVHYRGSLMRMGTAGHILGIRKAIREAIGKAIGDTVAVVLWRDRDERSVSLPRELERALASASSVRKEFAEMSFTHRREFAEWVASAKKAETRDRRAGRAVEMIRAGNKFP